MNAINLEKQIEYWISTAESDIETAEILINKDKLLQGLFFCHLTIEKALKAHYVKTNKQLAPKTHKLIYLLESSDLVFDKTQKEFLAILQKYQLEGRYPEYEISEPEKEEAQSYLKESQRLFEWLIRKL